MDGIRTRLGLVLLFVCTICAFAISLFDYFWTGNGIHGTYGALLVVVSSLLMLLATGALLVWTVRPHWLRGLLLALIVIDIAGTGFAAYMLEATALIGACAAALLFWIVHLAIDGRSALSKPVAVRLIVGFCAAGALGLAGASLTTMGHAAPPSTTAPGSDAQTWPTFNGDLQDTKFASAAQITPQNVGSLHKAWEVHTGDMSDGSGKVPVSDWSATPLFVNDTVYVSTPFYRVFAIAPDTGKVKWTFDTHAALKALTQPDLKTRGVAYWEASAAEQGQPCQKIVYVGTMEAKLYAVDADTGKPCQGFGAGGVLDVNQWNTSNAKWPLSLLQPPTVYKDTLFVGWAGKDWADTQTPPGQVFAVDARTGKLKWTFHALPPDIAPKTGTSNVWASMSLDPERGILYLPVSSPSPNFFGGNRKTRLPMATSVTALNADTGAVLWSRQIVHHDIWDYDTNAAPTLVDLKRDGQVIPALVQTSKMGFLFVLNRVTGEPVYPIEEKPVPQSDAAGEQSSPTQPYVALPEPTVPDRMPGISRLADWATFGACSRTMKSLRYEGRYTPPSVQGSLAFPSTAGGIEWGGGAVDPDKGIYVVNSSAVAQIYRLIPRDKYEALTKDKQPSGYYPQTGSPYGFYLETFLNFWGMPCWNGPYGTLSAYDLNTGHLLWRKPFGEVQRYGFYMPESWGSVTIGGPLITRSGLIFIGGSMDARVRAVDLKSGKVLWRALVDAPAVANPATYVYKGRQYVVFVAGGNAILKPQVGDQVVAYALPGGTR